MDDYISREAAAEVLRRFANTLDEQIGYASQVADVCQDVILDAATEISLLPAADVEPVGHVHRKVWGIDEYYGEWLRCPICGYSDNANSAKYCGGCGAKMDLEDENGN